MLPWIIIKGPDISLSVHEFVDFTPNTTADLDASSANASGWIVACAAVGIAMCLLFARTRRRSGLLLRLPLLLAGAASLLFGAALIYDANHALDGPTGGSTLGRVAGDLLSGLTHTILSVTPGPGAYALVLGGLVVVIGSLMPGRAIAPAVGYPPSSVYGGYAPVPPWAQPPAAQRMPPPPPPHYQGPVS